MCKLNRTKAKIKAVSFLTSGSDPIFSLVQFPSAAAAATQKMATASRLTGDPVQNHHADISRWPESPSKLNERQPLQTSGRLQGALASALHSHALRSHQSRYLHTYLWPKSSGSRQHTSTRWMRRLPMQMEERAMTSPLVSDDPRLHQQESNEDGHHVDIKAVSQDAVALDRVELLRKHW